MFGLFKKKQSSKEPPKPERLPPVPDWRPDIKQPLDQISDRIRYYTRQVKDFAVFTNGTVAILPDGLSDAEAHTHALKSLHNVFHAHPDMNPMNMDDGNIVVEYKSGVLNVVFADIAEANWEKINTQHQRALATHEVLITPRGNNTFDDFGKKALFGRCYMFMDAQAPAIVKLERCQPVQRA